MGRRVRTPLEAVRDSLGRVAITNGVEGLLGALRPKLDRVAPGLEIHDHSDRDIHLRGRGLSLSPLVLLSGRTAVVLEAERGTGVPALVFPVTGELWNIGWVFPWPEPVNTPLYCARPAWS